MRKRWKIFFSAFLAIMMLAGCGNEESAGEGGATTAVPYEQTEFFMGTVTTIRVFDEGKEDVLADALVYAKEMADRFTAQEAGSEVDKVNANAGIAPVAVSEDTFELVQESVHASEYSGGLFDVTILPLTNLWRIGFDDARKPEQYEIDAVLPLINYQEIELNEEEQTVFLKGEGMSLDLGGIAKGFMTDKLVEFFLARGVENAIIDLGGNVYVMGHNARGEEWTVGIQDPFAARNEVVGSFRTTNMSVVTSGIYERYLEVDGETYHHLLDPRTGFPFESDIAGVTIVSEKSVDGDALATTVFGKGVEEGLQFIETLDGIEAIFVNVDKEIFVTEGIQDRFTVTNDGFTLRN